MVYASRSRLSIRSPSGHKSGIAQMTTNLNCKWTERTCAQNPHWGPDRYIQTTPGIICIQFIPVVLAAHIIAASGPMPVFRAFGYLPLRGYHFEPCPRPADDAIIGLTDRFCLAAGVIASDQTPNPCGMLSWECGRIRTCVDGTLLRISFR